MSSFNLSAEILDAIRPAVCKMIKTTRGANAFGVKADVLQGKDVNTLIVVAEGGQRFTIKVRRAP